MKKLFLTLIMILSLAGCSPEVGSNEWCANMKVKSTGEWTQNETKEYAMNCIFNFGEKDDS